MKQWLFSCLAISITALFICSGNSAQAADCKNAQTTSAMLDCTARKNKQLDASLIQMEKQFSAYLGKIGAKDERTLLAETQRNWRVFTGTQCRFESKSAAGGTLEPLIYAQCQQTLKEQRFKQLSSYYKQRSSR